MKWLLTYLTSSIGKKQVMGATGCCLVLFVLGHMIGNLQLLILDPAAAQAAFNTYSHLLTKSKLLLYVAETGLVVLFGTHLYLAITLKLQNYKARGTARYVVEARKGRKQFPTFVMIWSGLAIAAFIVWHILTLRNGVHYYYINPDVADGIVVRDMWLTTVHFLGNPLFAAVYITIMLLLGFHMWHAISSAFQTMGINHQKWTPIIDKLAVVYCVVVACGFGITAAGTWAIINTNENAKAIIEQAKDPNYQSALEALSQKPIDEQKRLARPISARPEKAKFIVERQSLIRSGEGPGPRGGEKRRNGKFKSQETQQETLEETQNPEVPEIEGGEQ